MGLLDRFRPKNDQSTSDASSGGGASHGERSASLPSGEGGPHYWTSEIDNLRWGAVTESVNLARAGLEPRLFTSHEMLLSKESALLHEHEVIRSQVAQCVAAAVRDTTSQLWQEASGIAEARNRLREIDDELIKITQHWRDVHALLGSHPDEVGRYYELRLSKNPLNRSEGIFQSQFNLAKLVAKYLPMVLLVFAEFLLTGYFFELIFPPQDVPFFGYIVSLGIMTLLVAVPHLAAKNLKQGMLSYSRHDAEAAKSLMEVRRKNRKKTDSDGDIGSGDQKKHRNVLRIFDNEEAEDRVFRWVALSMCALLLALMIPLSFIRADHIEEAARNNLLWVPFFLFLQLGTSAFFFLREWQEFGQPSHNLYSITQVRDLAIKERNVIVAELTSRIGEFGRLATYLRFNYQSALEFDTAIVEEYLATIYEARHAMSVVQPGLQPYIYGARLPLYVRPTPLLDESWAKRIAETPEASHILENPVYVTYRHPELAEAGPYGRSWIQREWNASLHAIIGADGGDLKPSTPQPQIETDSLWMVTMSPIPMLRELLRTYWGLDLDYERPPYLDQPMPEGWEEPPSDDPIGVAHEITQASGSGGEGHSNGSKPGSSEGIGTSGGIPPQEAEAAGGNALTS